jgi:hypothetical protein
VVRKPKRFCAGGNFMNVMKPDNHKLNNCNLPEIILRLILRNIKETPEYFKKEMEKNIKY